MLKNTRELLPGKRVVIEYKGKTAIKTFADQITHIDGDDIHVKGVTKSIIGHFCLS